MPSFVISDCEKGLINAVEEVFGTDLHHAYCFHHIMKNFNKKFKNKDLKGFAWDIAKATTDSDFEEKLKILNNAQPDAFLWLTGIGWPRISLLRSPVCRYLTLTSNNVESVNNRVSPLHKLPIAELLLGIK
jgi:hypothetical protein